ncbi:MAG: hypothetical protein IT160_16375 [Bryobacterales bacterium]|nr:hypothetical protein [Bryobacterales bacterium]
MADQPDRRRLDQLLGGYAAGTLTPQERKALFEAALTDQTLFDALAREEPLRELLADPEARAELRAALEQRRAKPAPAGWRAWLRQPALGGLALAAAVGVITLVVVVRPWHGKPTADRAVEMAQRRPMEKPLPAPAATGEPSAEPRAASAAPSGAAPRPKRQAPRRSFALRPDTAGPKAVSDGLPAPPVISSRTATDSAEKSTPELHAAAPPPPSPPVAMTLPPAPAAEPGLRESPAAGGGVAGYLAENTSMRRSSKAGLQARPESARPAGPSLSITVLRNGAKVNPVDLTFTTSDNVRLVAGVPASGHLYVVARRGAEPWQLLFPADPASEAASRVEAKASYYVPAGGPLQPDGSGDLVIRLILTPTALDLANGPGAIAQAAAAAGSGILSREIHLKFR